MPIYPAPFEGSPIADTDTPFDVTLAVANTEEAVVAVPALKIGRKLDLVNEGPGSAFISFDGAATLASVEVKRKQSYSVDDVEISTDVRFIGDTGKTPRVHGVLWSSD